MAAVDDIRAALATAAETVDGLQGYHYVPAQVNTPCAVVAPDSITFDVDLEHDATYRLPVTVLVSLGDWESAQQVLDPLVSHDGDLVAALNAVTGFDVQVLAMQEYGLTEYGGTNYLGAQLIVEVFT